MCFKPERRLWWQNMVGEDERMGGEKRSRQEPDWGRGEGHSRLVEVGTNAYSSPSASALYWRPGHSLQGLACVL